MADPYVVVGGGLAGLAAAARLAKAGHPVELYERSDRLGGRWAPYAMGSVTVDDAPAVLGFPAPWRDLFRKSGRPLEAELTRAGYRLDPAEPATVVFGDGTELRWPSDRGEQLRALTAAYGRPVAERWRDLVDRLDGVWQALRPLGWESELRGRSQLTRDVRRRLLGRQSLARLGRDLGHPHLEAMIRSIAYRQGSVPERTPALAAVDLSLDRTFGRWQVQGADAAGRSSVLIEALAARLALRKVSVQLNTPVQRLERRDGRVVVRAGDEQRPAAAVVVSADPWHTFADLLVDRAGRATLGGLRRLRPALAPAIHHSLIDEPSTGVSETLSLTTEGVPTVTYRRPVGQQTVISVHDFRSGSARPAYGAAWDGRRSWLDRPPISTGPGLFLAGPWSAAGSGISAEILSGALAAYGADPRLIPS
jgi:UDP-galactopyranose mutase